MNLKPTIFAVLTLLFAVSCGRREVPRTEGGFTVDISGAILESRPDTTVNLGKMRSGEIVQYDAWLHNTDRRPLVIIGVESSCGCTSVEYERRPVPLGEKGRLSFRFDSRGLWGPQMKLLEIRTSAGPVKYKLFVTAEVEDAGQ